MAKKKKNLTPEVDLVSIISIMSVCICFLLTAAAWLELGSMSVKQAVGGAPAEGEPEKVPSVWALVQDDGSLVLQLQDASREAVRKLGRLTVGTQEGKVDEEALKEQILALKSEIRELKMALIKPQAQMLYEDLIDMMDLFKKEGITELGVAPL